MNVTLTPQLEEMVRRKIEAGLYESESDVVEEALRLMAARDRLTRLRAAIAIGDEQYARGDVIPFTPELLEEMKRDSERMAEEGIAPDPDVCPQ